MIADRMISVGLPLSTDGSRAVASISKKLCASKETIVTLCEM